MIDFMLISYYY